MTARTISFLVDCQVVVIISFLQVVPIRIEEMHFTDIRRRILKIKPQLNLGDVDDNKPVTLIADGHLIFLSKLAHHRSSGRDNRVEHDCIKK
jgi:hypothetical protein